MGVTYVVRPATIVDAPVIAHHRAEMFADMGHLPPQLREELIAQTLEYLRDALRRGEYVGWLAIADDAVVIAGAGVQRRRILPRPLTRIGQHRIAAGREAIVLNVFTEKAWRRKGIAERLMQHVLDWAAASDLDTLVLHASDDGRALYERLGFVQTNEMRYAKPLR